MNEIEAYRQFSKILNELQPYSIELGLDRVKAVLENLGNPQNNFQSIVVGGTNGKGSVCQFLTDAFIDAGLNVGTYTSPHLIQINERFKINNKPISYSLLLEFANYLKSKTDRVQLTYFEFLTVLAFLAFSRLGVDIAILEIGMGGEFDAVNTTNPILSILTHISLDHKEYLGNTHEEIAKTKMKIIRELGVVGKNSKIVINTIKTNTKARLFFVDDNYLQKAREINIKMQGLALKENIATAMLAIDVLNNKYGFNLDYNSFKKSFWQGRFEVIHSGKKIFILDGAHNINAALKLVSSLKNYRQEKLLIFSALKHKDWKNVLKILIPNFNKIILTSLSQHKLSENPINIKTYIKNKKVSIASNTNEAIERFLKEKENIAVITGSLYLIGEAKASPINIDFLP